MAEVMNAGFEETANVRDIYFAMGLKDITDDQS